MSKWSAIKLPSNSMVIIQRLVGAYYFAPVLRALIPHLQVPKQAEHANTQGYLAIGSQIPERAWARLRG